MRRRWFVRADTSREAVLNGTLTTAQQTTLGNLRDFVKALEQWPDNAKVKGDAAGCVMKVITWQAADPYVVDSHDTGPTQEENPT